MLEVLAIATAVFAIGFAVGWPYVETENDLAMPYGDPPGGLRLALRSVSALADELHDRSYFFCDGGMTTARA